jgi:hypothetical protein
MRDEKEKGPLAEVLAATFVRLYADMMEHKGKPIVFLIEVNPMKHEITTTTIPGCLSLGVVPLDDIPGSKRTTIN